jgi:hypothetical protein
MMCSSNPYRHGQCRGVFALLPVFFKRLAGDLMSPLAGVSCRQPGRAQGRVGNAAATLGHETIRADASPGWIRLGAIAMAASALAGLVVSRRLPN